MDQEASVSADDRMRSNFERQVRDALAHLHDVPYLQTHALTRVLFSDRRGALTGRALHQRLVDAIEALRSGAAQPGPSTSTRTHQLLVLRYLDGLEVVPLCTRLGVSKSEYHRVHRRGLAAVSSLLGYSIQGVDRPSVVSVPDERAQSNEPDEFPESPAPGVLPLPPTSLIGRAAELARIVDLLDAARLVTLTGPAGVGKTRVAVQVAATVRDRYRDGVLFVALAPVRDPRFVIQAVAAALEAPQIGDRSVLASVQASLRPRQALLVLDNFEQVLPAAEVVATLLENCPGLSVLATSRARLHLYGECEFVVAPLPVPDPEDAQSVARLAEFDASRLFLDRARAYWSGFTPQDADAPAIAAICARLDGLPLGIELAAARVKLFPPQLLATRLERRLQLLTDGPWDVPERHQTLRGAIAWSYDLLNATAQRMFRALAIFAGGSSLEAIERVWRTSGATGDALRPLGELVDQSMIGTAGTAGELRVEMLETLQEYGLEMLGQSDEQAKVGVAHVAYFLELAERGGPSIGGPDTVVWLARLSRDYANLRAALDWYDQTGDTVASLRLSGALWLFWRSRGLLSEGREHLARALRGSGVDRLDPRRAQALMAASHLAHTQADWVGARTDAETALEIYRTLDDRRGVIASRSLLGTIFRFQGLYIEARPFLAAGLALAREEGDPWLLRNSLTGLGALETNAGDLAAALPLLEEGLTVARKLGDVIGLVQCLAYLGIVATYQDESDTAESYLHEALQVNEQLGDLDYVATLFDALAGLAGSRCQYVRALRLIGAADELLGVIGMRRLPPIRQARRDHWLEAARQALGDAGVEAAAAEGRKMRLNEAYVYAQQDLATDLVGAPATIESRMSSLPVPMTSFVGRDQQVADVRGLLQRDARLVTLSGAGGVGKTRLALRVAATLVDDFPDGICFVDLQPIRDAGLVAMSIARGLGIRNDGSVSVVDGLAVYLHDKHLLLVLDNFEQVVASAPVLADLLASAPRLRVLVTSRELLHLGSEFIYMVPPLALPELATRTSTPLDWLTAVAEADATRLFVARARQTRPHFDVTEDNAGAIAAICQQLDGLPLAIELAAARVGILSPRALLTRLASKLTLLTTRARDQPARHQTMDAAIAWSYDLLTEPEQLLFRRLAVFVGGFTLETVDALYGADVLEGLTTLVDKSLVTQSEQPDGELRFALLETVRAFALEQIEATGEGEIDRRQHANYFVTLAESAGATSPRYPLWFERLDADHSNVRAAYIWCRESGELIWQARLVAALGWSWLNLGRTEETRAWAEETVAAIAHLGTNRLRAGVLYSAGLTAYDQGDLATAQTRLAESLALWEQLHDESGAGWAELYLSRIACDRGYYARARGLAMAGLARFQAIGEAWAEAFALTRLGLEAASASELDAARGFHEKALAILRGLGDEVSTATAQVYLGTVERAAGDLGKAAQLFAEALTASRDLRWINLFAERLAALAGVAAQIGDTERSARLLGATMARLRAAGAARLLPSTRATYERDIATVRDQLGEEAFARETVTGAALSRDAVIAEALAVARDAPASQKTVSPAGLTAREAEVLGFLARGWTNQKIADELVISLRTVERHLTNIYGKIGARNRADATVYAITHGLYCPSD